MSFHIHILCILRVYALLCNSVVAKRIYLGSLPCELLSVA